MTYNEKKFLIYYPFPVLIVGIIFPIFLEGLRTDEFISMENIKEGGWVAVAYLASPYILLSMICFFIRNPIIMIPPLIGFVLFQVVNYLKIESSSSSTSALGYFVAPLIQIIVILPTGLLIGFLLRKRPSDI